MSPQELQPAQANLDVLTAFDPKALWYIHGEAYDLSGFIQSHPGGPFALVLGRGRDCTALFECYHPFTHKPAAILPKYKVKVSALVLDQYCVDVSSHDFFRLPDGTPEPFWAALKQRCGDHVRKHKIPCTMSWPLFAFFVGVAVLQAAIYVYGYLRGSYFAAIALGVCSWILFTPGHEGIHYAMSDRPWVNQLVGYYCMSGLSNPAMLEQHHNYGHHSFTNDYMRDPDTHVFMGLMRVHEKKRYTQLHKLQCYDAYVSFCFTLAVIGECLKIPIQSLCQNSIMGVTSLATTPQWVRACMIAHLLAFVGLIFVLPCYMPGGLRGACVFKLSLTYMLTAGALFAHMVLATHSTEHSIASAKKPLGWAQLQVEGAFNFRLGSFAWAIVSGGSSIHIEHHLFPGLSVEALMQLSPIVQQTCKDFDVTYKSFNTYRAMFHNLRAYLKRLAIPPVEKDVSIAKEPKDASKTAMAPIG